MNLYNDIDPKACAWTRELIAAGEIPPGDVVCKSITDLDPDELSRYTQCHFFNGIAGWALALKLAGWPATRPVWCASLPCQPFSAAGRGLGIEDERHLWPVFFALARECQPERIFGEQVAQAVGFGWLDGISADLEAEGYAVGAAVLGAHSVGAPHIRQRLYWMAVSQVPKCERVGRVQSGTQGGLADGGGMGLASIKGLEGQPRDGNNRSQPGRYDSRPPGSTTEASGSSHWSIFDLIPCRDGKSRRIESGTFPLAYGLPRGVAPSGPVSVAEAQATGESRVARLKGYGNAIVPQVAAEFIQACEDAVNDIK